MGLCPLGSSGTARSVWPAESLVAGFGVWDLRFGTYRVWGLGFGVWSLGLGFVAKGLAFRLMVSGLVLIGLRA